MDALLFEKKDHIAFLKFNRPKEKNAFSPRLIMEMYRLLGEIQHDNDIWVVILGSTTPGIFSSGMDLRLTIPLLVGFRKPEDEYDRAILEDPSLIKRGTFRTQELDRPLIAAVDGVCMAAGFEVVMSTDIRIATKRSTFALPEVKVGIVASTGGTSKLAGQIPYAKAMEMNLTAKSFSAQEMLDLGFLNAVVEEEDLWTRAEEYARMITANAPLAVRIAKQSIQKCLGRPIEEAMKIEQEIVLSLRNTEDAREGPRAFLEKRKPKWKAR